MIRGLVTDLSIVVLHVFCFPVMVTLPLALSITLPMLQQVHHEELTSSLQSGYLFLILTVLSSNLLVFEPADDGKTSHFQHNYLSSSC
jgi:hypothetical protein